MFRASPHVGFLLAGLFGALLSIRFIGITGVIVVILICRILLGFFNALERRDKRDVREGNHHPR